MEAAVDPSPCVDGNRRILPQKSQQSPLGSCFPLDRGAAAPSGAPEDAAAAPVTLCSPTVCFSLAPAARPLAGSVRPRPCLSLGAGAGCEK